MQDPVFTKQDALMNSNELELYYLLKEAVGLDYLIVPQVHLEKLIKPIKWSGKIKFAVGHISRWSVDFALFDIKSFRPLLAIELNGISHTDPEKIKRDNEVKRHLEEAGIPLETYQNHKLPSITELSDKINSLINPLQAQDTK